MSLLERLKNEALRTRYDGVAPSQPDRLSRSGGSNHSMGEPMDNGYGGTSGQRVGTVRRCAASLSSARLSLAALSLVTLSLATLTLAACSTSAPIRYFSIEPVPAPAASSAENPPVISAYNGPPLQVRAIHLPPASERSEVTTEVVPGQWQIRDFDHWIAPLDRLARQALSEDLAARLPPGRLVFPGAAYPPTGADLTVNILSFDLRDGLARMALSYTLRERAGPATQGSPPSSMGAQLRLQAMVGDGVGGTARAWSMLLGQLADHVTTRLDAGGGPTSAAAAAH